jgi:GntR family transcriptional regulator
VVDRTTGVALKHVQIREFLREAISRSEVGTPLPSERELVERFGVARMTVRQAVDALAAEGLLERVHGRGTFVARPKVDLQVRLSSYTEEMHRRGLRPSSRVLLAGPEPASPEVAAELETEPDVPVLHLHRLRLADGEPMALEHAWLPTGLLPHLDAGEVPDSLYAELERHDLLPDWGEDTVDGGVADEEEARLLQIPAGAPVLRIRRRAFAGEQPVEVSSATYRADRYSLWFPVARPRRPVGRRTATRRRSRRARS